MIAVLIVMTWIGGYSAGPIVTMQEFSNPALCDDARKALIEESTKWGISDSKLRAFCVSK